MVLVTTTDAALTTAMSAPSLPQMKISRHRAATTGHRGCDLCAPCHNILTQPQNFPRRFRLEFLRARAARLFVSSQSHSTFLPAHAATEQAMHRTAPHHGRRITRPSSWGQTCCRVARFERFRARLVPTMSVTWLWGWCPVAKGRASKKLPLGSNGQGTLGIRPSTRFRLFRLPKLARVKTCGASSLSRTWVA